jgi:hypothetical protein
MEYPRVFDNFSIKRESSRPDLSLSEDYATQWSTSSSIEERTIFHLLPKKGSRIQNMGATRFCMKLVYFGSSLSMRRHLEPLHSSDQDQHLK